MGWGRDWRLMRRALGLVVLLLVAPVLAGCFGADDEADAVDEVAADVWGCTDSAALNHDASATRDDGSCTYESEDHEEPEPPVGNETELAAQAQATVDLWSGESRVLLILVHPTDSVPHVSAAEVASITSDVGAWFSEVSYGAVSLSWTVAGWYALDNAAHARQNVYQAVLADGYDLSDYDRMVVGLQNYTSRSSSTQGVQYYNVSMDDGDVQMLASRCDVKHFKDDISTRRTLTHELGHSFGLDHAKFESSLTGEIDQYGNQLDTMGSSPDWRHFSAAYKHQMGWLSDDQVELVSASGEYALRPLEGDDPHALRVSLGVFEEEMNGIVVSSEHFYFLEVRDVLEVEDDAENQTGNPGRPDIMSGALNGVIINRVVPNEQHGYPKWSATAHDATPDTPTASSSDFQLPEGRTFSDTGSGVHITALSVTDEATTVRIEFNSEQSTAPVINSVEAIPSGDGFSFTVDAEGDDLAVFWNFEVGFEWRYSSTLIGSGTTAEHTFPDDEARRVFVRVSDMRGGEAIGWVDINGYENQAPVIESIAPTSVEEATFEMRAQILDDQLLTYLWDLGDGSTSDLARPNHVYADAGEYAISLTISDGEFSTTMNGTVDTADAENQIPTADAGPDITAVAGEVVTLDGSASDDPDNFPTHPMRHTWSSSDGLDISDQSEPIATVIAPSEPGTYILRLQVSDGSADHIDTMTLTVTA